MNASDPPPVVETPPTTFVTNPSSPEEEDTRYRTSQDRNPPAGHLTIAYGIDAYPGDGRCSMSSSHSDSEAVTQHVCDVHGDGGTAFERRAVEGICADHAKQEPDREEGTTLDDTNADGDASGPDADLEKGGRFCDSNAEPSAAESEEIGQGGCCRVCQLTVGAGGIIKLGCACKDDLALAHQQCAETWFKIRGNRTCEICGSTAQNVFRNEGRACVGSLDDMEAGHVRPARRSEACWQNQPLCNRVLVCVLLVLIAFWIFRVTLF